MIFKFAKDIESNKVFKKYYKRKNQRKIIIVWCSLQFELFRWFCLWNYLIFILVAYGKGVFPFINYVSFQFITILARLLIDKSFPKIELLFLVRKLNSENKIEIGTFCQRNRNNYCFPRIPFRDSMRFIGSFC